jgi:replication-associated recombination protein RarA
MLYNTFLTAKRACTMFKLTQAQSDAINSVGPNYSINWENELTRDTMHQLETRADDYIAEATGADVREDLGGITVYLYGNTLVAFYDYERAVGHVFSAAEVE